MHPTQSSFAKPKVHELYSWSVILLYAHPDPWIQAGQVTDQQTAKSECPLRRNDHPFRQDSAGERREEGERKTGEVLGPKLMLVRGLVKFVPAVAYHFRLNLPATLSQPRTSSESSKKKGAKLSDGNSVRANLSVHHLSKVSGL